jgi:hypothetical protein
MYQEFNKDPDDSNDNVMIRMVDGLNYRLSHAIALADTLYAANVGDTVYLSDKTNGDAAHLLTELLTDTKTFVGQCFEDSKT